jgi:dipeptidyl-peptidase-4
MKHALFLSVGLLGIFTFLVGSADTPANQVKDAPPKDSIDTNYLRDHAATRGFMLGRPTRAKPTPDGKAVLFLRSQPRVPQLALHEFDVATKKSRELLTPELVLKGAEEKLTPEEKARRERLRVSVGGFTDFQISDDGSLLLLSLSGRPYLYRRSDGDVRELPVGQGTFLDPKFSPDGKSVSYVLDHDLYVFDLATNKERRITTGGTERLTHGLAEFVAQEEMDRHTGYWWSPDSRFLVYQESDASDVEIWYVADPIHPDRPAHPTYYPRPGKNNVKVRVGIVSTTGGDTTWIDWDVQKYPYLARVHWQKHGPLTLEVQTRDQRELVLLEVDPKIGKTNPLIVERDDAWVNLRTDVPEWLPDGKGLLWVSEEGGGPRLELRKPDGSIQRVVVPTGEGFQSLVDADPRTGQVVYRASRDPTQSQLYRVGLEGGKPTALTTQAGLHAATFAKDHGLYVLTSVRADAMPTTTVHRADSTLIAELEAVAEKPPFTPRIEFVKVGDGEGLYGFVVRPTNFDASRKYPVVVDVYGGPHHQVVLASMGRRLLSQWLAEQGFVVVAVDNRGTPGRGRDWERAISRKFGSVPLDDQVAGLKALGKKFPELDLDRVGIVGWSFGGYMSALAVLRRPDVFHAGVAGAPVVDWLDYDTHYTERYLGMPDTDKKAYDEANLLTYANDLKRPLLIVHGTADDNVYFRHSLKLSDALFRAGKDFEILPLSGLTHMVPDPVVTERLWSKIARHFRKHLGEPTRR